MKKQLIILVLIIPMIGIAQPKPKALSVYVGPQVSVAVGDDLSTTHSAGIGLHSQVLYGVSQNVAIGGRLSYTYLFGKKSGTHFYEPGGGNYGGDDKHDGMSDVGVTGSIRYSSNGFYGGLDGGFCLDFFNGDSQAAGLFLAEFGYSMNSFHAMALYFLLCGDPKMQIGLRYSIRLGR